MRDLPPKISFTTTKLDVAASGSFCSIQDCLLATSLKRRGYLVESVGVHGVTLVCRNIRVRYDFDKSMTREFLKCDPHSKLPTEESVGIKAVLTFSKYDLH